MKTEQLLETAVLGKRVEDFISSDIGQYLVGRAEEQSQIAMEKLKTVASWRARRVRELQDEIKVADSIQQWLADAILDGLQATRLLEDQDA